MKTIISLFNFQRFSNIYFDDDIKLVDYKNHMVIDTITYRYRKMANQKTIKNPKWIINHEEWLVLK